MNIEEKGLTLTEVEKSRKQHGSNEITKRKRKGFFAQYLSSFGDPIIRILLIALAVNVIFLFSRSGWYESAGIAVAVVLATLVSTISEYGSESAFEKLSENTSGVNCRVRRAGALHLLPAAELVVGDVVLIQAGERIAADGRMLSGEITVDQSALNGETKEARKYFDKSEPEGALDLSSRGGLFKGSVICEGEGVMVVEKVGNSTFYGQMALEVQEESAESPLKMRLRGLARTISKLGYTAAVIVALANLFNLIFVDSGFDGTMIRIKLSDPAFVFGSLMSTVTLAITVIVMAVPEGLPMMITVVLSANMKKMLKDNVLVRKLVGIETAGSLNILFTDKTGTLTRGRLTVTNIMDGAGKSYESERELSRAATLHKYVMRGCLLNTDSQISGTGKRRTVIGGNATDKALLEFALKGADIGGTALISHEPFNSRLKYSKSHYRSSAGEQHIIKGAPEIILEKCTHYFDADGTRRLLNAAALRAKMNTMAERAVRMLAFAHSSTPIELSSAAGLTLVCVAGIRDDVRREARSAVSEITGAGVQTVMITGDNRETAVAIAREIRLLPGKPAPRSVLTSSELASMSDAELKRILPQIRVIARALPTDKSRLVRISQEKGLVTGMTGDGINDAPALKKADVGFAMGSGTEVAKEAGDIVIIDNNIASIAKAILYGRTIFKSIRKFIIFQLTINLCAVSLSVICPFLGINAPLTVMQMLWVNMIMDTLAGLAFSGEVPKAEYMREAPKKRSENIMNRYMYSQIVLMGGFMSALCIAFLMLPFTREIFHFGSFEFGDGNYFMTAFFALFIFAGVFGSLNARTHRLNLLAGLRENRLFILIMLFICGVQILLIYFGGTVFRTTWISPAHLRFVMLAAFSIVPADLLRKLAMRTFGRKGHI